MGYRSIYKAKKTCTFNPYNKNLVQLGEVAAQMHSVADTIKQPILRWSIGFDNVVKQFVENAPVVLGHREKDLAYLGKLAAQLEETIFDQPDNAFDFGLCHGDVHLHNVMLQPEWHCLKHKYLHGLRFFSFFWMTVFFNLCSHY